MMLIDTAEGTTLWTPTPDFDKGSTMRRYMDWLAERKGLVFDDYESLWHWSVSDLEGFWASIWDFFRVIASKPYSAVLTNRQMPGATWFDRAELNYAAHIFRNAQSDRPALVFQSELQPLTEVSWEFLTRQVASVAAALRSMGVGRGDRVVAYLPNIPQTVVAFLACASLGAIWSSCSPDFGSPSVIDRFRQIEPKVLFAVDGYRYGGKDHDRRPIVAEIRQALPTLQHTVLVSYLNPPGPAPFETTPWGDLLSAQGELTFEPVPFDHPLWVLYSSGTTGLPKPIIQGQGGILLEHFKAIALHCDLGPGDRFFWFTTTGWMMWNFLVGGLLVGSTILLYDGSPAQPDMNALWKFAEQSAMTFFGTSAAYIMSCKKADIHPGRDFDLSRLKGIGSTGSPLPPEGFEWAYREVKPDVWLVSLSGGTDVCTAWVGGSPLLPVHTGEIQCRCLGAKVEAFDEAGRPLLNQVGELVVTEPMPSMPLYFWNDPGDRRYRESYFSMYSGVWRHGDWIRITPSGGVIIYGRSDSTINRLGVRIGTSEIYRLVEGFPEVLDSLVIDLEGLGGMPYMPLFVVLRPGVALDDALKARIKDEIRRGLSPRHVPDDIFAVAQIPKTLSGKKMEVPVRKILMGTPVEQAASPDSMSNPDSLQFFVDLAGRLRQ